MQRQQQVIDQHTASLSEQDRQKYNQLSYVENYHYLAQHNLLEHDTESESESESETESELEFSVSDSESEDYLPDLCDHRFTDADCCKTKGLDPFPLVSDTKATEDANKVSNILNINS